MKKEVLYSPRYEIGFEVKTLVAKNLKDGLILSNSSGKITGFDNKNNTYKVAVTAVNGDTYEGDFKENEIVLADLTKYDFDEEFEKTKAYNSQLNKRNLIITSIGCGVAVLVVAASIIGSLLVKEMNLQITILAIGLVLAICIGAVMLVLSLRISKQNKLTTKKLEQMVLLENATHAEKAKEDNEIFDKVTKIKNLYDSGVLTEEEYKAEKQKLLKEITK